MLKVLVIHIFLPVFSFLPPVKNRFHHPISLATRDHYKIADTVRVPFGKPAESDMVKSKAEELITFAQTLKGTPYKYACSDPKKGFDCSGFVQYVFHHFNITVPRSSIAFTNVGKTVDLKNAMPGDLILFTGTNKKVRKVGHVGIVIQASDTIKFIHSSSGKSWGVNETTLGSHYKARFIKVVRLLE
ncbi:NlpC/P60 family protein [Chryseolinea soli]|uniref:NlpC/P60 family protein n=2 Tax=Chryseolinea soli TaxID=2321403 RepID=A0A385SE32_9BACT|nr:NlpC/P60 family protein [Chryseolinea soli]